MKKELSKEQMEEIKRLSEIPDEDIDYSEIPPIEDWNAAEVGKFFRPVKQSVTIRLDSDVISWLKEGGKGYQTRANTLLRSIMERQRLKHKGKSGQVKTAVNTQDRTKVAR